MKYPAIEFFFPFFFSFLIMYGINPRDSQGEQSMDVSI